MSPNTTVKRRKRSEPTDQRTEGSRASTENGEHLNASQHRSKERILTQPEPAKIRKSSDAVVLKEGSLFLLTTEGGDIPFELPHGFGLFFRDCRFLDGFTLTINGVAPTVLSGLGTRCFETHHHLTNHEMAGGKSDGKIARNTIAIRRHRLIRGDVIHELQSICNYGRAEARLRLEFRFRSRFQDLFVVKGFASPPRGKLKTPKVVGRNTVELAYEGKDGIDRITRIVFHPAPTRLERERAVFEVPLKPEEERQLTITLTPSEVKHGQPARESSDPRTEPAVLQRWLKRSEAIWMARSAKIRSSNPLFDRVLRRALLDLRMLRSRLDGDDYFAAGVPWFVTLFGRDCSTVALQTLPYGTDMARQTLQLLARYQAQEVDHYRDAAPGKILHEFRAGELARLDAIPQSPAYYGTVDATMLFLILMAEYVAWSGDLELARELRPNIELALGWMDGAADSDGDGYFDYGGKYKNGLVNQGWKDAGNAIVNADGSLVEPPVALCEVQAYGYRAWRQTAVLLRRLGDEQTAVRLERQAENLRTRFDRDFWDDGLGCYVLARQAGGRPAAVVSSNAGQVLWGGIAEQERAARVADRLMAPDMFSGWGIRTLSTETRRYNPMSYHLGSVWPHDNGLILTGLRRYGHDQAALRVFDALFDAAAAFRHYRLPELFCGDPRSESPEQPIRYPVACSPQAWASGALPHALWNLLGLSPEAPERRLRICRPRLPGWLAQVEVNDLRVGSARVDLAFHRIGDDGHLEVKASVRDGELRVEHTEDAVSDAL